MRSLLSAELRSIGTTACLAKASEIEEDSTVLQSLHFRNLGLTPTNLKGILSCIKQSDLESQKQIKSISFSHNPLLGNYGAQVFAKGLKLQVREVGLVGCNIQDEGGYNILEWIKVTPSLLMICIEQNQFSHQLQYEFRQLREHRPDLMIIF